MKKITFLAMLLCVFSLSLNAQDWMTKALDDEGEPTFNWSKASEFVPILVSETVAEAMEGNIKLDMRPDDVTRHLWVWSETYVGCDDNGGINSFGQLEDHFAMTVSDKGWSGLGIIKDGGNDFSFIDDTYVLHFAIKGNSANAHAIGLGAVNFAIGESTILDNGKVVKNLGTWPNDGEWYYFDIPIKDLKQLGTLWPDGKGGPTAYTDNFFWTLSGGTQGVELHLDNVFLYKDSTLQPQETGKRGDINGDDNVNVTDVTTLVNIILGTVTADEKMRKAADLNNDDNINVSDVTTLVNIILGTEQ